MKATRSAALLLALGMGLAGCSSPDANGVDVSRPSIFNYLQSPPVAVPSSPIAPVNQYSTPQVPGEEYSAPVNVL